MDSWMMKEFQVLMKSRSLSQLKNSRLLRKRNLSQLRLKIKFRIELPRKLEFQTYKERARMKELLRSIKYPKI